MYTSIFTNLSMDTLLKYEIQHDINTTHPYGNWHKIWPIINTAYQWYGPHFVEFEVQFDDLENTHIS